MVNLKFLFAAFFILLVSISFSQQKRADSLIAVSNNSKVDSTRIDLLLEASNLVLDFNPKKAIQLGEIALKKAQSIQDSKREQQSYVRIGAGYEDIGDITNAIANFNESIKIATKNNDIIALGETKLSLGIVYSDLGNQQLSIEYYTSAMECYSKSKDMKGLCRSYVDLSDALFKSNNSDKAIFYLNKAKELSLKNDNYLLLYIYTNIGEVYCQKHEYDLARENAFESIELAKEANNLYILSSDYLILTKVYLAQNDLKNARINVEKGLQLAQTTGIKEILISSYNLYSQTLEKQKDFVEALKYRNLYMSTKDSLQSTLNNNLLQAYESEKRDGEMAVMKSTEIQKDAELKKQHLITAIILVTLILVIGFSGYVLYTRNKLKEANLELEIANSEISDKQSEIVLQNNELVANNEQIKVQSKHIEELNSLKDRLFAIISHDLRTPFNNLKGILNLLTSGDLSKEKFQTIIPMLEKSLSTASGLLDNLLHWSNSQLKGEIIELNDFEINRLVKTQLDLFEKQATDKQIILINEIPEGTIVFADSNMIDVVLRNLVANAIKFCHAGGKITISSKQMEGFVEISVQDEGIGISPNNIPRIFQEKGKFTTLGTNREFGTGLGLLLCKDFVEKLNGKIGVESKVNEGSRFWFTLLSQNA